MATEKRRFDFTVLVWMLAGVVMAVVVISTAKFMHVTRKQALEQRGRSQLMQAEQAADSISLYMSSLLGTFADMTILAHSSDESAEYPHATLQKLYEREGDKLLNVATLDGNGVITSRYPPDPLLRDEDISQNKHVMSALTRLDSTASGILTTTTRAKTVALFAPISRNGRFDGAIGGLLDFSTMRKRFLGKLAHQHECEVFLLDERGTPIIELPSESFSGKHDGGRLGEDTSPGLQKILGEMVSGKKGFEQYERVKENDGKKVRKKMLVAYAPVHLPGERWALGIAIPRDAATGYLVYSPMTILSLVGTRIVAILLCAVLFHMLNKQRLAARHEAARLLEERKLLAQLEESEERYRTLVENHLSPVLIFQDSRIKFANQLFYSLSGYTPEEVASEDFDIFCLIHEDDHPIAAENIARLMSGEEIDDPREVKFVKKSGEIISGLAFSSIVHFDGKPAVETIVTDITPLKDMERELRSTKERLQYLLDNAPIMIFSLDTEGNISYANTECLRVTGYSFDWVGKSFAPIVHPDDLALAMSKFEESRNGAPRRDYRLRIRTAAGESRMLHIVSNTIQDDGRFEGSLIIARDITEKQRLQQAVKEARDRLANIIENAGDAIITLDTSGCMVSWNRSAEAMFRFTDTQTIGKSFCSLLRAESTNLLQLLEHVAGGETVRDREIEHTLGNGTRLTGLFTFSPIRDITGEVVGISCFAKDITERRRLEKQLEMDKEFIDRLIENANALIAVINEEEKIAVFNRRFEEVTGFKKEEVLGKHPIDMFVPAEYREMAYAAMNGVKEHAPVVETEIPIISKEGKVLTATWSASAVSLMAGHAAIVLVGQDVTEQKRMHEELLQSKKLASIGELVSGVAHELNNPLTVVMGYSQLLTAEQKLSDKHREMARNILDAATRSKRIVENLLAFARKKKMQKHEVNINEILENTLSLREHNLMVNNVKIVRKYDEKLPTAYADGHQLQQVFLNLINNAFDAMYEANQGGTLEVKTYKRNEDIVVEVADDGPGIPESAQDKIFDPFFTTKEVGKGTGLGMSLTYGILKEHGGRIYLDRTYRKGAKFIIELPLTHAPTTAA